MTSGLLQDKVAIIYGGGGNIGGAVGRAYGREGAKVFLAGRTLSTLEAVAEEIREGGGFAEVAEVDATDEAQVDAHAAGVVDLAGSIDISLNVIGMLDEQGTPFVDMSLDDYERGVTHWVRTQFLTNRAAARQMVEQGSGVLLFFGGYGAPVPGFHLGSLQVAFQAVDTMRRDLANELGRSGVRVLTLQTAGIYEVFPDEMRAQMADVIDGAIEMTKLGRVATLADVGNVAVFAASDMAASMTGTAINITCGAEVD